ncbi:GNAT family N-acetyltransferase [Natronolimnobius sp. AArcel1]|uniref:GNAT family N-acetyltransferase n=1 Tax=Natronolimnobius sp. AArcel1 TaxID=1679093 RepID=UPI0013ED8849|nr:GNAT family N-acetyltransferase [Natronolimnobius sp. AArcel1]NGM71210.1 GNAT family N-acetyltransferase [Natronolimnobius sp. AArcel1]
MAETDTYTIRRFRATDLEGYCSLYESVFGSRPDDEWFAWKYRNNPYADHVPIYLAEGDGEIVGARSFFALPIRADRETLLAFQPCDTMVHEDHRRQGLFTRMTEAAIADYQTGAPDLCFNYPNSRTRAGNKKLGWRIVAEKDQYYRMQNPGAVARSAGTGRAVELAASAATPLANGYAAARSTLSQLGQTKRAVTLERHETAPINRLTSLYHDSRPDVFHVPRDEQLLRWRLQNPNWEYSTYLATVDGQDVAAVITGTQTSGGLTKTSIFDVLTRNGEQTAVLDHILAAVCQYNRRVDLIVALGGSIPRETLMNRGFLPDNTLPLSPITETTTQMVRPLMADETTWTLGEHDWAVDDPTNWKTSFISHDTE